MALDELNDLFAMVTGDDATTLRAILERNAAAAAHLEGQSTVYQAYVGGDPAKIAAPAAEP